MKRKNYIKINSIRTIKKALPRFLSLLIMSMLGVFTFSGLQATAPDMLKTLDCYLDKFDTYDIKIISTMGLEEEDINTIQTIEGIKTVEGSYSKDVLMKKHESEFVVNVSSIPKNLNKMELLEGSMPEQENEIVVEENMITKNELKIGDTIILDDEIFRHQEVKIVGTIKSSLYFNNTAIGQDRGNTSIGAGKINYYTYTLPTNFDQDYYSAIYLTVNNAKETITSSEEYISLIETITGKLEDITEEREDARYNNIYNEANDKIIEKENELKQELNDAKKKLDDAKEELDNGKKNLNTAANGLQTFKKQLDSTKIQLDEANNQLTTTKAQLDSAKDLMSEEEYNYALAQYNQGLARYQKNFAQYQVNLAKYNTSKKEYQTNFKNYNTNLTKYENSLNKYNQNKKEAEEKISDAKKELQDIEHPTWYIYNRTDYSIYSDYIDDTNSITNLSKLFPTVFFAVAILVSLISINRMVEEDRLEIGTLKSLGFSNNKIMSKYLLFSFLATITGSIIGSLLGLTLIPLLIFSIYGILFTIPNFQFTLNLNMTLLSFIIVTICVCGTTVITVYKVLKEKPSELMRAKAPKNGKRVILERIKLIWNHINFSKKITIRNLFRYKKRVIVTVVGIAGCTALMLCGFGIRDAIVDIADMQYNKTYKFDASVYTNNFSEDKMKEIFNNENIIQVTPLQAISAEVKNIDVNLFITKDSKELSNIVNLVDRESEEIIEIEANKVIITDKLADLANLNVGDTIEAIDVNNNTYQYEISSIVKNYLGHFIYMTEETYEKFGEEYKSNMVYINTKEITNEETKNISEELLKNDEIINVSFKSSLIESTDNMLKSLNKVVLILIILAAMLSFVVLYNLSNINITERKREISTLKVLGFYDKEVDNYITKENIILTILGILIGLGLGYFLTKTVISTVEIEKARFIYDIKAISYIYASALSILFTVIVNVITHFNLKKINMIESLKSVE